MNDVDGSQDPYEIVGRTAAFADDVLAAYRRHLAEITNEHFWADMNVKVLGYLRCCREVAPQLAPGLASVLRLKNAVAGEQVADAAAEDETERQRE